MRSTLSINSISIQDPSSPKRLKDLSGLFTFSWIVGKFIVCILLTAFLTLNLQAATSTILGTAFFGKVYVPDYGKGAALFEAQDEGRRIEDQSNSCPVELIDNNPDTSNKTGKTTKEWLRLKPKCGAVLCLIVGNYPYFKNFLQDSSSYVKMKPLQVGIKDMPGAELYYYPKYKALLINNVPLNYRSSGNSVNFIPQETRLKEGYLAVVSNTWFHTEDSEVVPAIEPQICLLGFYPLVPSPLNDFGKIISEIKHKRKR